MQLRNHIAYRYLTDESLAMEMVETIYPMEYAELSHKTIKPSENAKLKVSELYDAISPDNQTAYYITDTVIDKLEMLRVQKNEEGYYDWGIFKDVKKEKLTFIFKDNTVLRLAVRDSILFFSHMEYKYFTKEERTKHKTPGTIRWTHFWVNRYTGLHCSHFKHDNVKKIETMVYRLLCFFYLSKNEERIVSPGKSYGTKKQHDALSNDGDIPITIVNSCWNITSIRTEGFNVSGHFRMQPYKDHVEMIFIEPFKKNGYVRKALKKETI